MAVRFNAMKAEASEVSITIFPIIMAGKPFRNVGAVLALFLEKASMKEIDLAGEEFMPPLETGIRQACDSFSEFVHKKNIDTDYALFGEYIGTPQTGVKEVRCIVVDREGNPVWVDTQTPEDQDFKRINPQNPMLCTYLLAERLRTALGLPDPNREDAPRAKWAEYWDKESGLPSEKERVQMEERRKELDAGFPSAKVLVFPILNSGAVSRENALHIAELLNTKQICHAEAAPGEVILQIKPETNQLKKLWELAGKFRQYIRENQSDADYSLYAQYTIDSGTGKFFEINFVLCDRSGEWVIVDFQNEYQEDVKSAVPITAQDCDRLVVKRLENYLSGEK
ncbi:MAG TPA: hypothetical protein VM123_13500 [archaeon]|nr:hypothetical protein [archaeon]